MSKKNYITTSESWTEEILEKGYQEIEKIAIDELGLDVYTNQIEIISSEQMIDAYTTGAMPVMYNHWSFGRDFIQTYEAYKKGQMGLAYEVVINSNPCISYLMEENTTMMQFLVIAHAAFGHNHFFKNNYLVTMYTDADAIIDYLLFAKNYIAECEEKYGEEEVERVLDAAHSLKYYGNKKVKKKLSSKERELKIRQRIFEEQRSLDDVFRRTIPQKSKLELIETKEEENLLYFLEKNSPIPDWQKEIIRIVRKIQTYFYPQIKTKLINEGFATTIHYEIVNRMYDKGLINDGFFLEFLDSHTSVIAQPPWYSKYFSGINVYALGFAIFQDIKRVVTNPTEEDREVLPTIAGTGDYISVWKDIVRNHNDSSFIDQYLTPNVIKKFKLFTLFDSIDNTTHYEVDSIHNEDGYERIRELLSYSYDFSQNWPNIVIEDVDDRTKKMYLKHTSVNHQQLDTKNVFQTLRYLHELWPYEIMLNSYDAKTGELVNVFEYPAKR